MLRAVIRGIIVSFGVLLQLGFFILIQLAFYEYFAVIAVIYEIISILIILFILKNSTRLSNDLPWIILILILPIFGTILLITVGRSYKKSRLLKSIFKTEEDYKKYLEQDPNLTQEVQNKQLDNISYIINRTHYPVSKNNDIEYFNFGEKFFPELISSLKEAKKFIFMEYFIINKGKMWDEILQILKQKANDGLDIRIIYDDMGSLARLSTKYPRELSKFGIKCIPFNKLTPFRGVFMNNRDHRKMCIIDGKVAFTGGVNLSDEYININSKFGVWKDNAVKVKGDAVWNFTVMFLTMWNSNTKKDENLLQYKYDFSDKKDNSSFVLPYAVTPLKQDLIGEDVYINMINSAKKYVYIMTPYLIIDNDMTNALIRASKRGVDVRILVPKIPDKKIVYSLTSSFFNILYSNGVKLYKFTPGFVHSKTFLSDDIRAVVGTINLDYRSLYLHFENGLYMENSSAIKDIKLDFEQTFNDSELLLEKDTKVNIFKNIWQSILRLFAPLF